RRTRDARNIADSIQPEMNQRKIRPIRPFDYFSDQIKKMFRIINTVRIKIFAPPSVLKLQNLIISDRLKHILQGTIKMGAVPREAILAYKIKTGPFLQAAHILL